MSRKQCRFTSDWDKKTMFLFYIVPICINSTSLHFLYLYIQVCMYTEESFILFRIDVSVNGKKPKEKSQARMAIEKKDHQDTPMYFYKKKKFFRCKKLEKECFFLSLFPDQLTIIQHAYFFVCCLLKRFSRVDSIFFVSGKREMSFNIG